MHRRTGLILALLTLVSCIAGCARPADLATTRSDPDAPQASPLRIRDGQIEIDAIATGIDDTDPVEFFLIPRTSGKDYEALAITSVKPSQIHDALVKLGMSPGKPTSAPARRFWPRGERVIMTFRWMEGDRRIERRAEDLIIDAQTGAPLPQVGFVFTGSYVLPQDDGRGQDLYAANVADPQSIASNYNEPGTVLDVPRRAPQGEMYGFQKRHPAYPLAKGQPITITLRPEMTDGSKRVIDLTLHVRANKDGTLTYELVTTSGKPRIRETGMPAVLSHISSLIDEGKDPFVQVTVAENLSVMDVRQAYGALVALEQSKGLRLEPPAPGELFYEAFFPDEAWREASNRVQSVVEIHLDATTHADNARLVVPLIDGQTRTMSIVPHALAEALKSPETARTRTAFLFVTPDITYGEIQNWARPLMATHPVIYVFLSRHSTTLPAAPSPLPNP